MGDFQIHLEERPNFLRQKVKLKVLLFAILLDLHSKGSRRDHLIQFLLKPFKDLCVTSQHILRFGRHAPVDSGNLQMNNS